MLEPHNATSSSKTFTICEENIRQHGYHTEFTFTPEFNAK